MFDCFMLTLNPDTHWAGWLLICTFGFLLIINFWSYIPGVAVIVVIAKGLSAPGHHYSNR